MSTDNDIEIALPPETLAMVKELHDSALISATTVAAFYKGMMSESVDEYLVRECTLMFCKSLLLEGVSDNQEL